jgi:FkbM family methyltransferase
MMARQVVKALAYGALDLCTAGRGVQRRIGGETICFPARWCRWYPADYEAGTFAFLRTHCRLGDTVIDVGAHFGLFSVVMARSVGPTGRVISFEPTPLTRAVLRETVRINGCDAIVEVRGEAVSKTTGTATFFDTGDVVSNANSLVHTQRSQGSLEIKTVSLDDFVAEHHLAVRCLKVDVEGAELDLLLGASKTLMNDRPTVALSLHPASLEASGHSLADVWGLLQQYEMCVRLLASHGMPGPSQDAPVSRDWFIQQDDLFDVALEPQRSSAQ